MGDKSTMRRRRLCQAQSFEAAPACCGQPSSHPLAAPVSPHSNGKTTSTNCQRKVKGAGRAGFALYGAASTSPSSTGYATASSWRSTGPRRACSVETCLASRRMCKTFSYSWSLVCVFPRVTSYVCGVARRGWSGCGCGSHGVWCEYLANIVLRGVGRSGHGGGPGSAEGTVVVCGTQHRAVLDQLF